MLGQKLANDVEPCTSMATILIIQTTRCIQYEPYTTNTNSLFAVCHHMKLSIYGVCVYVCVCVCVKGAILPG